MLLVVARISREMHNNPFSGSENRQFMKSEQSITGKSNKYSRAAKLTSLLLATACSPTTGYSHLMPFGLWTFSFGSKK